MRQFLLFKPLHSNPPFQSLPFLNPTAFPSQNFIDKLFPSANILQKTKNFAFRQLFTTLNIKTRKEKEQSLLKTCSDFMHLLLLLHVAA
jgi:hypothetical protein